MMSSFKAFSFFILILVALSANALKRSSSPKFNFLNGLFDSAPITAQRQIKLMVGSELYSLIKIASESLSAGEQKYIENIGRENELDFQKNAGPKLRDCERHPSAGQGPCWNPCRDPILDVGRHESQSINANGYEGPTRIERIVAVICPWHIRDLNDRIAFSKTNVTIVRSRGRKNPKDNNRMTDDAGHLIPSVLGGLPDIDCNAFPQAVTASRQTDYRRSEQYMAKFLQYKSSRDGSRMVKYDIVLNYDDNSGTSTTSTRPASVHYVASFYEWQTSESFKLVEISTEVQDNSQEYVPGGDKEEL